MSERRERRQHSGTGLAVDWRSPNAPRSGQDGAER
jgi:hypothetical protein